MNTALESRFEKAWARRKNYVTENRLEAFRLINWEELEWPLSVDLYLNKAAVIQVWEENQEENWQADLEKVLRQNFKISDIFYKQRFRKEKAPLNKNSEAKFVINEYGNKFLVNLSDYLDTGLFLDHREARRLVAGRSAGKIVANLFAYTGAFSVYAARGGATFTHTVDLSRTYLDWAKENFLLNGIELEKHWTYKMDAFEFFKYSLRKGLKFDLMVIDPPTFSKNKGKYFSVQKDHVRLLIEAARLLNPGGEIFFSTNFLDFKLATEIKDHFEVENTTKKTIPIDFEVHEAWSQQIHESFLLKPKLSS